MKAYSDISLIDLNDNVQKFVAVSKNVCILQGIDKSYIKPDRNLIAKIERRVHQRAAYYEYFHGYKINQIKEAALRAYWTVKYKPFSYLSTTVVEDKSKDFVDDNIRIAFWTMIYSLCGYIALLNSHLDKFKKLKIPCDLLKTALHTLGECDLSKEALIEQSELWFGILVCYNK